MADSQRQPLPQVQSPQSQQQQLQLQLQLQQQQQQQLQLQQQQQQQQQHVSFVTPVPPTYSHDDEPIIFSNYYAPLSQTFNPELHRARAPLDAYPTPDSTEYNQQSSSNHYNYAYPTTTSPFPPQRTDSYGGLTTPHANEIIDQSTSHNAEKVVEESPNERYVRLNTLLGKGAYKVVYKAIDREEGYEVAWNTMQATQSPNNKDLEHEIQILKSVRHPNIIAFHDAWYGENEFVFVTELMTSGTLREYIRKLAPLPNIKIIKRWSRQILKGLAYLHGRNPPIIHRDIKCDNIFINGAHGEVKIGDMGTAEMKLGKKYTIIGTPEFMAPEMYEEQGYNEKVDIYAFGMCLLEMATGEYPYGECTNAAQIYKKVSAGIKPACLQKVQNSEVLPVITSCLGPEDERMSSQEILEHPFLAVEPDVVLLAADPNHVHLTLQVVFKGMDKLSVKFDFNVETDTAEEVVREMIEEQVLPERYQHHITKEINRILRDIDKPSESEQAEQARRSVWRRESDIRSELERTRLELKRATDRVMEIEAKCETFENRARATEARHREAMRSLREIQMEEESRLVTEEPSTHQKDLGDRPVDAQLPSNAIKESAERSQFNFSPELTMNSTSDLEPLRRPEESPAARELLVSRILEEYSDDTPVEEFVQDCALAAHRTSDKACEWIDKLQNQDIMTVGDLRDLHDEDWAGIVGLTVFAQRALKNMLKGKKLTSQQQPSVSPTNPTGLHSPVNSVTSPSTPPSAFYAL